MKTVITRENFSIFKGFYKEYIKELSQYSERLQDHLNFELESGAEEYYEFQNGKNMYLIHNESGIPIGFIILHHNMNCVSRRDCGIYYKNDYIAEIYIEPMYRRKKYASDVIHEVITENNGPFPIYILKKNESAKNFWKKVAEREQLQNITEEYLDLWNLPDLQLYVFEHAKTSAMKTP